MAARAALGLLRTVGLSAVDAAAFLPTAAERAVGGCGPQAEVCTASRTRRVVAALAGRGRVSEALA